MVLGLEAGTPEEAMANNNTAKAKTPIQDNRHQEEGHQQIAAQQQEVPSSEEGIDGGGDVERAKTS
jgi:hypothetical protein